MQDRQLIWLYADRPRRLTISGVVAIIVGVSIALEGNAPGTAIGIALGFFVFLAVSGEVVGREIRRNLAKRASSQPPSGASADARLAEEPVRQTPPVSTGTYTGASGESPAAEIEFEYHVWRTRGAVILAILIAVPCAMVAMIGTPSFVSAELFAGISWLGLATAWIFVARRMLRRGVVDDQGVRGTTLLRQPVSITWDAMESARVSHSQSGSPAGLMVTYHGGRLMMMSTGRSIAPAAQAVFEGLRARGKPVAE